jgi:hypothetical protein
MNGQSQAKSAFQNRRSIARMQMMEHASAVKA